MSFIVSYKGQFRPYQLPDLSHFDRIHHTYRSEENKPLKDHEDDDFEVELGAALQKKNNKRSKAIDTYKKVDSFHQQKKISYLARDLMSSPVNCLNINQSVNELLEHIEKYKYRHFPVLNDKKELVGIVTDRDIIGHSKEDKSKKISEFMTQEVLTALDSTRIQDMAKIMLHEKMNCLPIINDEHVLVGIITQTNILNYVIRSYPLEVST